MQKRSSKARELAGAVVELLLAEGIARRRRGRIVQRNRRAGGGSPCVDGEPSGSGKSGATSYFMTSITILPSSFSKWFIGWKT
jgi:hypothetical protein